MADFLKVEEVLNNLTIKEDMVAAEFGCGSADFALVLAKKLTQGKVYALDIQEEKLSALKNKVRLGGINNIAIILCDLEMPSGSTLQSDSLDIVLIPNLLFQAENKNAILQEGKRILKPGGQFLVIDWFKNMPLGPKQGAMNPDEIKTMMSAMSFSLKKEFAAGDYHYALLFIKE